ADLQLQVRRQIEFHDACPLADGPVIDVAALDVAWLAAAERQVHEIALLKEEVGTNGETAAFEFKPAVEKFLVVRQVDEAQDIATAKNLVGELERGNVFVAV